CLGTSQRTLAGIHLGELLLLGLLAGTAGVVLAFGLQWVVGLWLAPVLGLEIPPAGWQPALAGYGVGLLVLLAFGAPPVLALRKVPALRVIRRDLDRTEPSAWLVALAGLGGLAALLWWQAGSVVVGSAMLAGVTIAFAVLALLAWGPVALVRRPAPGDQHRPGGLARPGADGAVAADLRAYRPARPLAAAAVQGGAEPFHHQRAGRPGGRGGQLHRRAWPRGAAAVPHGPCTPG